MKNKTKRVATAKNRCHPDKWWQILIWIQLWQNDVLLLFLFVFLSRTECAVGLDSDHRNIEHPSRFFTLSQHTRTKFHEITFSIRSQARFLIQSWFNTDCNTHKRSTTWCSLLIWRGNLVNKISRNFLQQWNSPRTTWFSPYLSYFQSLQDYSLLVAEDK